MRVLIVSDIHANPWALRAVLADAGHADDQLIDGLEPDQLAAATAKPLPRLALGPADLRPGHQRDGDLHVRRATHERLNR